MLAASLIMAAPINALACTQVYMGSDLTTNGSTFVGRAEDWNPRYLKAFGVQERVENPQFRSFENDSVIGSGFEYTYSGPGYRYTYVRDQPEEWGAENDPVAKRVYSEAGINEHGVAVSATLSMYMNDAIKAVDPLVPTGIGEYNLTDVVLSISDSARDGVEKLGKIVDEHGSCEANQIIIADSKETWIFSQLSGHQWVAIKMSSDVVSANPNIGRIEYKVDLDDASNVVHSEGVVSVPEGASILKTDEDGTINIGQTYGRENAGSGQYIRYVQARAYFGAPLTEGVDYTLKADGNVETVVSPQLMFKPGREIDTFTALRSIAARGEQASNLNANLNSGLYSVGNKNTVEGHIFEIRHNQSPDTAIIQWTSLSRTEFSVALPSYSALLTEVPEDLYPKWDSLDASHRGADIEDDNLDKALEDDESGILNYALMDINTIAYNNRSSMAEGTRAYLDAMQRSVIAQQEIVDKIMQNTPAGEERTALANDLFARVSRSAYEKLHALADEMRAYVKAGDFSAPFVPSDYDPATQGLKTPISYAGYFVAPTITAHPVSAAYEKGAAATPLTVAATVEDGVQGSDAGLTFQWYRRAAASTERAAGDEELTGYTSSTLPVDTSQVGEFQYYAVATNAQGLSTTSDAATITVTEPKVKDPEPKTPEPGTDGTTTQVKKGVKGKLPKTGDVALLQMSAIALAGVAATGAGVVAIRRRR